MAEKTSLREAIAEIEVVGILSEKDLETITEEGKEITKGTLVIQTDETNFVTFKVFSSKLKKDGTANKTYAGILTVMNEYQSIAEVGKEAADKVSAIGKIQPNTYYDSSLQLGTKIQYQSNFFKRIKNEEVFEPKAQFRIEMYISALAPEIISRGEQTGEETGRLVVKGYLPTYNGLEPISLVVPEEIAEAVNNAYEQGQTGLFEGDIVNRKVVEIVETPVTIGKPKKKEKITYKNELLVTGCTEPYEDNQAYNIEAIKAALAVREEKLAEMKAKAEAGGKNNQRQVKKNTETAKASGRSLPF